MDKYSSKDKLKVVRELLLALGYNTMAKELKLEHIPRMKGLIISELERNRFTYNLATKERTLSPELDRIYKDTKRLLLLMN